MITQPRAPTPLSDLIDAHVAQQSPESWTKFLAAFRASTLGVRAVGIPESGAAGTVVSTDERPVSLGQTDHAGGRPMVLAFADPDAFAERFGPAFNAGILGEVILATVQADPTCNGILVNSALVEQSVAIDRATVAALLAST